MGIPRSGRGQALPVCPTGVSPVEEWQGAGPRAYPIRSMPSLLSKASGRAPGGSVKTEGLGDGSFAGSQDHRQAALDDATRPSEKPTGIGSKPALVEMGDGPCDSWAEPALAKAGDAHATTDRLPGHCLSRQTDGSGAELRQVLHGQVAEAIDDFVGLLELVGLIGVRHGDGPHVRGFGGLQAPV